MNNLTESTDRACGAVRRLSSDVQTLAEELSFAFGLPLPAAPLGSGDPSLPGAVGHLSASLDAVAATCSQASGRLKGVVERRPAPTRPLNGHTVEWREPVNGEQPAVAEAACDCGEEDDDPAPPSDDDVRDPTPQDDDRHEAETAAAIDAALADRQAESAEDETAGEADEFVVVEKASGQYVSRVWSEGVYETTDDMSGAARFAGREEREKWSRYPHNFDLSYLDDPVARAEIEAADPATERPRRRARKSQSGKKKPRKR